MLISSVEHLEMITVNLFNNSNGTGRGGPRTLLLHQTSKYENQTSCMINNVNFLSNFF